MKRVLLAMALLLVVLSAAAPALAQAPQVDRVPARLNVSFAPAPATAPAAAGPSAGHGFTIFTSLGLGIQHDTVYEETAIGLAGLNLGVGMFVTKNLAVLGRISGTVARFDNGGGIRQGSAIYGGSIQYWFNDRCSAEAGIGLGRWYDEFNDGENGLGLLFGFAASVFKKDRHHVRAGVEYIPVFADRVDVHNVGITVAYQYVR